MKLILSFFLFLSTFLFSFSQTYYGDIWLNSQADVDSFGAIGYTRVEGHLRIHDSAINDLSPLSGLTKVIGKMTILGNDNLTTLTGLNNLETITDQFWIDDNNALTTLDGLNGLDTILNTFKVTNNDNLTTFDGLQNLDSIASHVTIENNENLINLSGLDNLGPLNGRDLMIKDNPSLISINAFENTTQFYMLTIKSNASLTSLEGLSNLEWSSVFRIHENTSLESLSDFESLESISILNLQSNTSLTQLGLDNINSMTSFNITDHPLITSLNELDHINSLDYLTISGCLNLESLPHLSNTTSLFWLHLNGNNSLTSLTGLDNLTQSHSIDIYNNPLLTSLSGLNNLTQSSNLWISNNDNLVNFEGLNNLTTSGYIKISYNASLTSLNGFENLTYANDLKIENNSVLGNYCALDSLIANAWFNTQWPILSYSADSNLYNPTITDLLNGECIDCLNANPIDNTILSLGQQIGSNQTNATYQWLSCDNNYAIIPNETSNIFTTNTYGNFAVEITYSGCVDTSACITINALDIESLNPLDFITVSPNPTTDLVNLDLGNLENLNINMYNQLGQIVYRDHNINQSLYTLNTRTLSSGLYIIEVYDDFTRKQIKIIKQ